MYRKREEQLLQQVKDKECELEHFIARQYKPLQEKLRQLIEEDEARRKLSHQQSSQAQTQRDEEIIKLKMFILTQQTELESLRRKSLIIPGGVSLGCTQSSADNASPTVQSLYRQIDDLRDRLAHEEQKALGLQSEVDALKVLSAQNQTIQSCAALDPARAFDADIDNQEIIRLQVKVRELQVQNQGLKIILGYAGSELSTGRAH